MNKYNLRRLLWKRHEAWVKEVFFTWWPKQKKKAAHAPQVHIQEVNLPEHAALAVTAVHAPEKNEKSLGRGLHKWELWGNSCHENNIKI